MWPWVGCPSNGFAHCFQSGEKKRRVELCRDAPLAQVFPSRVFYNTEKFHVQQSKKGKRLFW
jgi:hypothetical protein